MTIGIAGDSIDRLADGVDPTIEATVAPLTLDGVTVSYGLPGALYNPVADAYYVIRAATQDNTDPGNSAASGLALLNGSGRMDRAKGDTGRLFTADHDIQQAILIELRMLTALVAEGLNVQHDPELWRSDPSLALN